MKAHVTITTKSEGTMQQQHQEVDTPATIEISILRGNDQEILVVDVGTELSYVRIVEPKP